MIVQISLTTWIGLICRKDICHEVAADLTPLTPRVWRCGEIEKQDIARVRVGPESDSQGELKGNPQRQMVKVGPPNAFPFGTESYKPCSRDKIAALKSGNSLLNTGPVAVLGC